MIVSVVIPTFNRADSLALTLHSLSNQVCPPLDYEMLVIDNGSTDHTKAVCEAAIHSHSPHAVRYIYDPVPGLLTGRHRGALEAQSDLLVFVDDDIDADPGWLQAIIDTFADSTVQLVGGRSLPCYGAPAPTWLSGFWRPTRYGGKACSYLSLLDLGDEMLDIDANYVWGLNFAIRRRALLDLGGFHPDCMPDHIQHFQGDGESGLTMKANQRGYRAVYQPKALVYHRIPAQRLSLEYFERRAYYQGVCDSYTHIRKAHSIPPVPWAIKSQPHIHPLAALLRKLRRCTRQAIFHRHNLAQRVLARRSLPSGIPQADLESQQMISQRVRHAYRAGYEFHHNAAGQEPVLLQWVLRENYWDYQLPQLGRDVDRTYPSGVSV